MAIAIPSVNLETPRQRHGAAGVQRRGPYEPRVVQRDGRRQPQRPRTAAISSSGASRRHIRYGVAALVGFGAALAVLAAPNWSGAPAREAAETVVKPVITVQAGDTLWSVAGRELPALDPRTAVEEIRKENGLVTTSIVPGQHLRIPRT